MDLSFHTILDFRTLDIDPRSVFNYRKVAASHP